MSIKKVGKIWYYRHTIGKNENLISTHQTERRKAVIAADRIAAVFSREKATKQLAKRIIEAAKDIAHNEMRIDDSVRGLLAAVEREALIQAQKLIDDILPAPALLAEELWGKYLKTAPELKASTLTTKRQRLGKFITWAGDMDMRDMQERDCRKFLTSLSGASGQTSNNYISDLSSVWKASPELINPWGEHLRQKAIIAHKQAFSRDQVRRLLDYCAEKHLQFWHTAIMISYYTGLRLKDVVYFNRQQITKDGYIDLIPAKTARTGKAVRIPIASGLRNEMLPWMERTDSLYFFPEEVKKYEGDRANVQREFRKILDGAKMYAPGFGFHSLRHTFVTEALNAGISTKEVQAVVGHDAVELTEGTYYHGEKHADLSSYPEL